MTKKTKPIFQFALVFLLIGLGALGMGSLTTSKPKIKKNPPPIPVPTVRTLAVETGPQTIIIRGEGTVKPLREIELVPQVEGMVVFVSPALVNGGSFVKGQILLKIDPVDYELAVTLAKAKVKDAESKLRMAEEESAAAVEEWSLLHSDGVNGSKEPPPLVAKGPQLDATRARLSADEANLEKARLALERTELKAPFDGRVSKENVDVGQYARKGQTLSTLYSTQAAEVIVPLEVEDLFWLDVPGFTSEKRTNTIATVRATIAGRELSWPATVVRSEGKLDERTRMIGVVVRVEKPYARKPPLPVGLFVNVDITGRTLPKASVIPRASLHGQDVVWVVTDEGQLIFRKVKVARIDMEDVWVEKGLNHGDRLVISHLKAVTDGMAVRAVSAARTGEES